MNKIFNNIIETIGNTPIVRINKLNEGLNPTILVKLESFNPASSVKDRIAMSMILDAEKAGIIKPDSHIVEPTSGNTGIGLAIVCAAKGYKLTLTMPESMSIERRKILKAFGADLVLTKPSKGMKGAVEKAEELANESDKIYIPQQFKNISNPRIHRETTAVEILDATGGKLDVFVSGIGTGGTITGVGEVLRKKIKNIKIYAVEPEGSPVLSGGKPGPHKIQGIGAGFIPDVLNTKIYDDVIKVNYKQATEAARNLAELEGIFVGISSGAAMYATLTVAKGMDRGQVVLGILPDTGERYLTTELWNY
ncbi:MAG: cysteine synthase A [Candidatus Helarchaeota archaeon]|nr:cysteine synthase A [Candidatus Helarchaeota archaeon]